MASPSCPYGYLSMTLMVMRILLPIRTGSIGTGWLGLRQTGISQCGFAILPLRVFFNDFESYGEEGETYPKGRHRNAKHSAATTLQLPLMFDALEWRSKVEFRPDRRPGNEYQPNEVICK